MAISNGERHLFLGTTQRSLFFLDLVDKFFAESLLALHHLLAKVFAARAELILVSVVTGQDGCTIVRTLASAVVLIVRCVGSVNQVLQMRATGAEDQQCA